MLRMPLTANSIQLSHPELLADITPRVPRHLLSSSGGPGIEALERAKSLMELAVHDSSNSGGRFPQRLVFFWDSVLGE